nr:ribonuclease H-like domain-containing protein [Tanacetum cinerariifolium]
MVASAKLLVLNPNEFELWKMMIEQYFLMTNYALWKMILNGDSPPLTRIVEGVETPYPPTTVEEKLARKNELKARGTLLMALPNEHQLKFNSYKSAKSLMEAIEKSFEGNKESKKVQKTLLKQQYENFNRTSSKGLDQIYDRLQKLISQLEIHGETIFQEDLNLKLLRSLPSEGDGLKVANSNADYESQKILVENRKESRRGHLAKECRATKHQDNRSYDWSDHAKDGPTNFALMAYNSSSSSSSDTESQFNLGAYKACQESVEARLEVYKKNETVFTYDIKILKLDVMLRDKAITKRNFMPLKLDLVFPDEHVVNESITSLPAFAKNEVKTSETPLKNVRASIIEDWVFDSEDENEIELESKQIKPSFAKVKFVKSTEHVKSLRKSVKQEESNRQTKYSMKTSKSPRGNQRN